MLSFVVRQLLSLGVVFLMFGFAGFNAASQSSISQPGDGFVVANSVLTTFLAYSGGGISAVFMTRFMPHFGGKWSYLHMGNGALGGVVRDLFIQTATFIDEKLFDFSSIRWLFALDVTLWLRGLPS